MASITNPAPDLLVMEGEIDLHQSPLIKEKINQFIERKLPRLFIDLTGVSYIDSSGIATFIEAMQRINAYGGKLALFGIRENVRNIFEIARLDQIFKIYPDKETAEKSAA